MEECVLTLIKVIALEFTSGTEKTRKALSGQPVSEPKFKPETSRTKSRLANHGG
jgi:hypothetical protein